MPNWWQEIVPGQIFSGVTSARFREQLRLVYKPAQFMTWTYPRATERTNIGTIRIGVSTVLLKETSRDNALAIVLLDRFEFLSRCAGCGDLDVALGPLKKNSRNLDMVRPGNERGLPVTHRSTMNRSGSR